MSMNEETKSQKTATVNGKKTRKISSKLLAFIVPVVVITVLALVAIAASLSKSRMTTMATETLESSISNQADNIEAWLSENLRYFKTVKHIVPSCRIIIG